MLSETEKLNALMELGIKLNRVQDWDILMELLLTEARGFVNADAGSIYIRDKGRDENRDEDRLRFTYAQNDLRQSIRNAEKPPSYSEYSIPLDSKTIAGYVATHGKSLNIADVYRIDPAESYKFGKAFDEKVGYRTESMLTIPLKIGVGQIIGVLQIINAQNDLGNVITFSEQDEKMMMLFASIAAVALERAKMTRSMLLRMIRMTEMRDPKETGPHVNRVGAYSDELYKRWAIKHSISSKEMDKKRDILRGAAMLHDVGKVAISDRILQKPGKFGKGEFLIMKLHTIWGAQLFLDRQSDFDDMAREVALNHHERWDGRGYPGNVDISLAVALDIQNLFDDNNEEPVVNKIESILKQGKKEEEIPIFARIVSLADVYDALSSKRVYKEAWDEKEVLNTIKNEAGGQFDPELVEILFENQSAEDSCLSKLKDIQRRYKDTDVKPGS